jgi:hypothetical protein
MSEDSASRRTGRVFGEDRRSGTSGVGRVAGSHYMTLADGGTGTHRASKVPISDAEGGTKWATGKNTAGEQISKSRQF